MMVSKHTKMALKYYFFIYFISHIGHPPPARRSQLTAFSPITLDLNNFKRWVKVKGAIPQHIVGMVLISLS